MAKNQRPAVSTSRRPPIMNAALVVFAFLAIGVLLGPNAGQVYTGTSSVGSDTVNLLNDGLLNTRVSDFSFTASGDKYKIVSVASSADGALSDFPVVVTVTYDSDMQADFDDLRFEDPNGTNVPYWIRSKTDSSTAEVWLSMDVPASGGKEITMTYGDPTLSAGSSISDVLLVGEAFTDLSDWVQQAGTWTVSGGVMTSPTGTGSYYLRYDTELPVIDDYVIEQRFSGTSAYYYGRHVSSANNPVVYSAGYQWFASNANNDIRLYIDNALTSNPGIAVAPATWYKSKVIIDKSDGHAQYLYDDAGTLLQSATGIGTDSTGTNGYFGYFAVGPDDVYSVDYVYVYKYTPNAPVASVGVEQVETVLDPGVSVGDDKIYYDGDFSGTFTFGSGFGYIDSVDVSSSVFGELPLILVGTTQSVRIDHGLEYSVTYVPKSMSVESSGTFLPGDDLQVDTLLTDADGNTASYQPSRMRVRLFRGDTSCLDDIVQSTSFVVPGSYLDTGHYQLKVSYDGYEFGGWSNEILADFDIGAGTTEIAVTSSPDPAPEGMFTGAAQSISGLLSTAVSGWMDVPIISDILRWLLDLLGVSL